MRNSIALALLALCVLGAAAAVQDSKPPAAEDFEPTTGQESVWANYTIFTNTMYLALDLLKDTYTKSAHACAELCNSDSICTDWSWCPPEAKDGCEVFPFSNFFDKAANLSAGTCLTSADPAEGRKAFLNINGPAVPWVAGYWVPPAADITGGQGNEGSTNGGGSGGTAGTNNNAGGSSVPAGCSNIQANTFVDASVGFVLGTPSTEDVTACCKKCGETKGCTDFMYCDPKAPSCTNWVTNGSGYTFFLNTAQPKMCLLLSVPNGKKPSIYAQGPGTPWSAGSLSK